MNFLTKQGNTGTGIRLKLKMIQSNTNTCLVFVAPLSMASEEMRKMINAGIEIRNVNSILLHFLSVVVVCELDREVATE
jgi:hypothetical protein